MLSPSILTNVPFYCRRHDLGCATGRLPFLILRPFVSLVFMQLDLFTCWQGTTAYENEIYLLPKLADSPLGMEPCRLYSETDNFWRCQA